MSEINLESISDLLNNADMGNIAKVIETISNPKILHIIAYNYNWDNGFQVPSEVIKNENCDLGTALMIFYNADGYRLLVDDAEVSSSSNKEWSNFLNNLFKNLKNGHFKSQVISYIPELSKVQIHKIRKNKPDISNIFLEKSAGEEMEIPLL